MKKRQHGNVKVTSEQIVKAVRKARGNLSAAADALGISRITIWNRCNHEPELKAAVYATRERVIDHVENRLLQLIDHPNVKASVPSTIFFLKTQGKRRGYVERVEQEVGTVGSFAGEETPIPTRQELLERLRGVLDRNGKLSKNGKAHANGKL